MQNAALPKLVAHIRRVALARPDGRTSTDGWLLRQFVSTGDEQAFAALVYRHGPMVRAVCRRVTGDAHAADDAFQAAFLVLARRAAVVKPPEAVRGWLYGVAVNTARETRAAAARGRCREVPMAEVPERPTPAPPRAEADELQMLDEEIAGLPEHLRAAVVLCELDGVQRKDAAFALGIPEGTLSSRLAKARNMLARRLRRRGVLLSVAALAGSRSAFAASVPYTLVNAATCLVGSTSPPAAVLELARGVFRMMLLKKLKLGATLLALTSTLGIVSFQSGVYMARAHGQAEVSFAPAEAAPAEFVEANNASDGMVLKYGDGQPDGKQSVGGSGPMIEFTFPAAAGKAAGVRIHGARYGQPQPPQESFLIYFLSQDQKRILRVELAAYALFERGPEKWIDVTFERPLDLPKQFWVALDFRAGQTKGVYVSYDSSTGGKHSRVGLPGTRPTPTKFGGDWMIETVLAK